MKIIQKSLNINLVYFRRIYYNPERFMIGGSANQRVIERVPNSFFELVKQEHADVSETVILIFLSINYAG